MLVSLIGVALVTLLISLSFTFCILFIKDGLGKFKKKRTNIIHDYTSNEGHDIIVNKVDKNIK